MKDSPSFTLFPKEWGIYLPYNGKPVKLKDGDVEKLKELRSMLSDKQGELVSYKFDISKLNKAMAIERVLNRLWANNMVFKFANQIHTLSDRPEYIHWWIWEDYERAERVVDGCDTPAPVYFST